MFLASALDNKFVLIISRKAKKLQISSIKFWHTTNMFEVFCLHLDPKERDFILEEAWSLNDEVTTTL